MALESEHRQYKLAEILVIWSCAALPLCFLSWDVLPFVLRRLSLPPAICYWLGLSVGMFWVAGVALWIIRREEGSLQWLAVRQRLWLNTPLNPWTGQPRPGLYWWVAPCFLAALFCAGLALALSALAPMAPMFARAWKLPHFWLWVWPAYANIFELGSLGFGLHSGLAVLTLVLWLASAVVAEELLFRGVLLTRMHGVFGRWDWVANALLYGAYSLFQPWMVPFRLVEGLIIAGPARRFRCNWIPLIVRGGVALAVLVGLGVGLHLPRLPALPANLNLPSISRQPEPGELPKAKRLPLMMAPKYYPDSERFYQVDLRSRDASQLDLRLASNDLVHALFDSQTSWPPSERMPEGFDWRQVMERGKNPGLGVRELHRRGLTGRGVGIGIVDLTLLTDHQEYRGRLKYYEELGRRANEPARMHGPAVASIAAGQTVGVAPEADLYYVALRDDPQRILMNHHLFALGLRRLLEVNRRLPAEQKIRAISLSSSWMGGALGYNEITRAIRAAEDAGIFVVDCRETPGEFRVGGLTRHALAEPDAFESYQPWRRYRWRYSLRHWSAKQVFVPLEARTTAGPTGTNEYIFFGEGGASWTAPYLAGMYALAAQANPALTPAGFRKLALETGRTVIVEDQGRKVPFRPILDPVKLVEAVRGKKG